MSCRTEEKLAFEICSKYLNLNKAVFFNIETTEEPDIQTIDDSFGIEVTQVIQPVEGELKSFFNKIRGLSEKEVILKARKNKKLKKYIDSKNVILSDISNGVIFPVGDNLSTITGAICKKLKKKLTYRKFIKNILFLIIEFQFIDKNFIEKFLINEIKKEENNVASKFDNYILYDKWNKILYVIDENSNVREIKVDLSSL